MVSVVVMAGYQNKREVKRYSKIVAENYGETFVETGYKPLRDFNAVEDGKMVSKPVIQFTLEKLCNLKEINGGGARTIACVRLDWLSRVLPWVKFYSRLRFFLGESERKKFMSCNRLFTSIF